LLSFTPLTLLTGRCLCCMLSSSALLTLMTPALLYIIPWTALLIWLRLPMVMRIRQIALGSEPQISSSASLGLRCEKALPGGPHGVPFPESPATADADWWDDEEADKDAGASNHIRGG
jgi:hypothetical protein